MSIRIEFTEIIGDIATEIVDDSKGLISHDLVIGFRIRIWNWVRDALGSLLADGFDTCHRLAHASRLAAMKWPVRMS